MQRFNLVDLLNTQYLKASPTRRVWIPKPGRDEKRPLGIPTIYDRALQALVKLGMEPEWEARFEPNSYGLFRRSTHDAIEAIYISIHGKPKYVLDADISKCFDRINHDALLGKVGQTPYRRLIKQWLRAGVFDNKKFSNTVDGTPQSGVISPLLANIALHGMEERLKEFAEKLPLKYPSGNMSKRDKRRNLSLIRYADDFVILHEDIKVVMQAKTVIQEWLSQIGLELKPEKTKIAHTLEEYEDNKPGFDFLGFNIRQYEVNSTKQGFKTLIKPSSKSIKTHYRKLADICDSRKTAPTKALIAKLNPVIRGWANYFSTAVSKEVLRKIDSLLWTRVWRWASRRHPNKSAKWVKEKYFPCCKGTRNWVLNEGEYILNLHADVPIVRHIKVKGIKSPLDGDWTYWSNRIGKYPGVRKEVTTLLKRQKNKCASMWTNL